MSCSRVKREACQRTQLDAFFSDWKVLIGPSDWEEHLERYRTHNLSENCSRPGLYELSVATTLGDGRWRCEHALSDIVVVYLGQAENVRTRLQEYGRSGSHLDHGHSSAFGFGLFKEILYRGYSIMFRFAPMANKKQAEKREAQLLDVFDYAWNVQANGACRREEILLKLDYAFTGPTSADNGTQNFIFEGGQRNHDFSGVPASSTLICGAATQDGFACMRKPALGRQRCEQHSGLRVTETLSPKKRGGWTRNVHKKDDHICGAVTVGGYACRNKPVPGRERCLLHRGLRSTGSTSFTERGSSERKERNCPHEEDDICGAATVNGYPCRKKPAPGRERCELHRGLRSTEKSMPSTGRGGWERNERYWLHECSMSSTGIRGGWERNERYWLHECDDIYICGAPTVNGHPCRKKPVPGRERCDLHKRMWPL